MELTLEGGEAMGKVCKDCRWCETTGTVFVDYWCVRPDAHGQKKVTPAGTCEHFAPKADECACADGRKGGCFLTSACVKFKRLPDDCAELETLRAFRDDYLAGSPLVKEYYETAPAIVGKIESSPDKDRYYRVIYGVIRKCVRLIGAGRYAEAVRAYGDMVLALKKEFCL